MYNKGLRGCWAYRVARDSCIDRGCCCLRLVLPSNGPHCLTPGQVVLREAVEIPFELLPSVGNMMLPLPDEGAAAVCRAIEATVA